jgi:hypothetical protein
MPDETSWYPRKQEKMSPEEAGGMPPQGALPSKQHVGITAEEKCRVFVHSCGSDARHLAFAHPI